MAQGIIGRLLVQRGFGFIETESGHYLFFHCSDVLHVPFEALREGQAVEFTLVATRQGPRARHVYVVEAHTTPQRDNQ
jgi:CspA family cold shock protein